MARREEGGREESHVRGTEKRVASGAVIYRARMTWLLAGNEN